MVVWLEMRVKAREGTREGGPFPSTNRPAEFTLAMASHPARPKFVMLGKSYVGKSSLGTLYFHCSDSIQDCKADFFLPEVMRLLTDAFREYLQPTQGMNSSSLSMKT
jgi:hypothetical protein